ncbi:MAG: hypothetical protein GQ554_05580 [Deltaproteobacteria bacterium]|nr:hypothetical protein [Deltaproteobacteria bacterium]
MKLLTILDSRLRGNDTFFQSVPSLSVIPAKLVLDLIGEQRSRNLIDNLSIVNKQTSLFLTRNTKPATCIKLTSSLVPALLNVW